MELTGKPGPLLALFDSGLGWPRRFRRNSGRDRRKVRKTPSR